MTDLLYAHMRALDPDTPTAKERLAAAVGADLAATLIRETTPTRNGCAVCHGTPQEGSCEFCPVA